MGKEMKESNGGNLKYNKRSFITVSAITPLGGSQAVVRMPRGPHQQSSVNRVSCSMQWSRLGSYWVLESSSPEGSQITGVGVGLQGCTQSSPRNHVVSELKPSLDKC